LAPAVVVCRGVCRGGYEECDAVLGLFELLRLSACAVWCQHSCNLLKECATTASISLCCKSSTVGSESSDPCQLRIYVCTNQSHHSMWCLTA